MVEKFSCNSRRWRRAGSSQRTGPELKAFTGCASRLMASHAGKAVPARGHANRRRERDALTSGTPDDGGRGTSDRAWCDLVACLLRRPSIRRSLKGLEIDPREIEACLKRYCSAGHPPRITPGAMKAPVETQGLRRDKVSLREALDQVPAGKSPWEHVIRPAAAVRRVSLPKSRVPKENPCRRPTIIITTRFPSSSWTARAGSRESSVLLPST